MMQTPLSVSGAAKVLPSLPGCLFIEVGLLDASGLCPADGPPTSLMQWGNAVHQSKTFSPCLPCDCRVKAVTNACHSSSPSPQQCHLAHFDNSCPTPCHLCFPPHLTAKHTI